MPQKAHPGVKHLQQAAAAWPVVLTAVHTHSLCCSPGGAAPGSAPRVRCADVNPTGTYMPEGTEKAADCGGWLMPGYYYEHGATTPVKACPANSYW